MIVFDLRCAKSHRFEGWFASADDFEQQKGRGLLTCPVCASAEVEKLPSSKIKRASEPERQLPVPAQSQAPAPAAKPVDQQRQMMAFIEHVLKNTEDVGPRFAEEARKIHREESPERAIRGTATAKETQELLEEGIPVMPIPVPPRGDMH